MHQQRRAWHRVVDPLLCVISQAGNISSATAMAGSCNVPLVSLVYHHLVGLCDYPPILSLKSPIRMSTRLKVPSHLSMACCCAFSKGPHIQDIGSEAEHRGGCAADLGTQ